MLILISRLLFMAAVWRVAEGKTPLPYGSVGTCNNASSEYYVRQLELCCSRCKPGTHLVFECTSNSDTICEPCQDGHYSENINHFPNCFSCRKCKGVKGLIYGTNCSADTKAVCVCKPGMFCSKRNFNQECEECKKYRSCKPGEYVAKEGSPISDVKCALCPSGTFSNHSNAERCKPHTQCEGRSVLRLGSSTTDTLCEMTPPPSPKHPQPKQPSKLWSQTEETQRMNTTTTTSLPPLSSATPSTSTTLSKSRSPDSKDMIYYIVIVVCVLVLLTLAVTVIIACKLRKRKGLQKVPITDANKLEQDASASGTPDYQCLLPVDRCQKEPSMTSSDSQSQPDSSHSSADWMERTSQDESIPEQPSVSSPMVNLSITATFNCQLNPTTASCSIPLNTSARTPHVEAPVPLSQEEVCISCQQEDGKEALQSVQESGPCLF
ncbi:tumor necrosis factor receptor superfamily member 1B-like isoform X2 [Sinocyclocheilus rhinocerous]|uniref:Tumor necrosis factor receptor superfamily member 1B-like n=1 Tax=Sinocyclocheilus rhinocerous TaxID=307959 RepID=A0A673J115_9TELE|nr:PREDICTED: tumor necrosis factor receptor superfamily member 1B-like isoform X2 [Sinocyclocheilus rhinocerous]